MADATFSATDRKNATGRLLLIVYKTVTIYHKLRTL